MASGDGMAAGNFFGIGSICHKESGIRRRLRACCGRRCTGVSESSAAILYQPDADSIGFGSLITFTQGKRENQNPLPAVYDHSLFDTENGSVVRAEKNKRLGGKEVKEKLLGKRISAYFTLEATMILTLVTGVIVVLIYLMFFLYNRCLADQDVGTMALRGCSVQAESKEELLQKLEDDVIQMDTEKYIGWKQGATQITLREDKVRVERTGSLLFPFAGIVPGEIDREWKTQRSFENRRFFPVAFLRSFRKIVGGK